MSEWMKWMKRMKECLISAWGFSFWIGLLTSLICHNCSRTDWLKLSTNVWFSKKKSLNEKINWLVLFSTQQTWFPWITLILLLYCWNQRSTPSSLLCVVQSVVQNFRISFVFKNPLNNNSIWREMILDKTTILLETIVCFPSTHKKHLYRGF